MKDKIIAILGPTASGKTKLGVKLAYNLNGEIVSADSRQVYKGMDIGTGKDLNEYKVKSRKSKVNESPGIPYYLIDVVSPRQEFNLAKYQKLAFKAIKNILLCGKVPIIVGGTGLYLQALVEGYELPDSKPDKKLRKELEKLSAAQLFAKLKKLNGKWAAKINESDRKNKRRLLRYLEIASPKSKVQSPKSKSGILYDYLVIGITRPREELEKRICKRLIERLEKEDMIGEVGRLRREGLSWKRLEGFGLEYKYVALYLQDKMDYGEMIEQLYRAIRQFAKRQMTWLRRWERQGRKIIWIKDEKEAIKKVKEFLNNS